MSTGKKKKKKESSFLVVNHGRLSAGFISAVVFKGWGRGEDHFCNIHKY